MPARLVGATWLCPLQPAAGPQSRLELQTRKLPAGSRVRRGRWSRFPRSSRAGVGRGTGTLDAVSPASRWVRPEAAHGDAAIWVLGKGR